MKEEDKLNLDIDMFSVANGIGDDESIFYLRGYGKEFTYGYSGDQNKTASGLLTMMLENEEVYDILSTAIGVFERETVYCQKCDKSYLKDKIEYKASNPVCPDCGSLLEE